jgi:hypothetical protein
LDRAGPAVVVNLVLMLNVIGEIGRWFDIGVWAGIVALQFWALVDCSSRKAAAFTAVDRLTKPVWMGILVVAGVLTILAGPDTNGPGLIGMIAAVAGSVYLVDVRPAIREITGGR